MKMSDQEWEDYKINTLKLAKAMRAEFDKNRREQKRMLLFKNVLFSLLAICGFCFFVALAFADDSTNSAQGNNGEAQSRGGEWRGN